MTAKKPTKRAKPTAATLTDRTYRKVLLIERTLEDAASIHVDNKVELEAVSVTLSHLSSGQSMLSERMQSLYENSHANDCLTHRRIEALTELVQILTDSHTSTYATLVDHCARLLREKETLLSIITPEEIEARMKDSATEMDVESHLRDAAAYMSKPLPKKWDIDFVDPRKAMSTYSADDRAAEIDWSPLTPPVCDHEIMSPRCTIRFLEGKRYCQVCKNWIVLASAPACTFLATHAAGIKCLVCGVTP